MRLVLIACARGHLDIVEYMHRHPKNENGAFHTDNVRVAIKHGNYHIAKFLLRNRKEGFHYNALMEAVKCPDLELITILAERWSPNGAKDKLIDLACESSHSSVETVELLNRLGYGCTKAAMHNAAIKGNLSLVKYLNHNRTEGCQTDSMLAALENGHFEVAMYLDQHRHETTIVRHLDAVARNHSLESLKVVLAAKDCDDAMVALTSDAMLAQRIDMLEYLHSHHSLPYSLACMELAAIQGNLHIIQFLISQGLLANGRVFDLAARNGHLSIVEYLHRQYPEIECTTGAMDGAALFGHFTTTAQRAVPILQ
ncbi:hypothetical protein SAMD00019534_072610 [Acytostelium subglobosum LB1]|uniref:hypothetical protein n=1 Tax=Acytostelium subglobosum LB1 TaxID=1410327 RepID=UPI0006450DFF|nr:hypothetical protein SAMD00019534_072610 [Acytostelium subglobosum LB1]GAM24086.1 hypothetical protein SAMD00019534_072610 [Acytostelium subglobosum LB1]|eukprot:XP_012753122.1 hypothetical protein SAMD00019534_072610 [Acytostelium subglobosum LB1]